MLIGTKEYSSLRCSHLDRPIVSLNHLGDLLGCRPTALSAVASRAAQHYSPFDMRRQEGVGKWRHIDNPIGELKAAQTRIHRRLLRPIEFPPAYCGALAGRSILDNADFHIRQPVVVCLDLKDCFPSISDKMVFRACKLLFSASDEVASLLTKLTTFQHRLPQGAPTSPVLASLVLTPLYAEVSRIAEAHGCVASYFVDDITISGRRARDCVGAIFESTSRRGFKTSAKKKRILPHSAQQLVTGIVVNRKRSVSRAARARIRERVLELSNSADVQQADLRSIWSKINFVKSVDSHQGRALTRFAAERLPLRGRDGPKAPSCEYRVCKNFRCDHKG